MIVDFAIENDCRVAVFGGERLISQHEVDNLQPRCSDRDSMRFKNTLLVRSAMDECR